MKETKQLNFKNDAFDKVIMSKNRKQIIFIDSKTGDAFSWNALYLLKLLTGNLVNLIQNKPSK